MKKMNRKGFTIVELVIVIAVIAILAGVMIPTFSSIVEKANKSAADQAAAAVQKELLIKYDANLDIASATGVVEFYIVVSQSNKNYQYKITDGTMEKLETAVPVGNADTNGVYKVNGQNYKQVEGIQGATVYAVVVPTT